jgi:hypothetical protein
VEQVHTVLKRSLSRLRSADVIRAISEIMAHDKLHFLDINGQEDVIQRLSMSDQTYMQLHAHRERLRLHHNFTDGCELGQEEVEQKSHFFEVCLSKFTTETKEVLAKFPELAEHHCRGALSLNPLHPGSETCLNGVANLLDLQDCLGRTHLHRLLDESINFKEPEDEEHLEILIDLLDRQDFDIDHQDYFGRTLLHLACQKGWLEGVKTLLECEADPSLRTAWHSLPLHFAAAKGSFAICKLLLEYRNQIDIDGFDKIGMTARSYARNKGHTSVQALLHSASTPPKPAASMQSGVANPEATICLWMGCEAGDLGSLADLTAHVISEHL